MRGCQKVVMLYIWIAGLDFCIYQYLVHIQKIQNNPISGQLICSDQVSDKFYDPDLRSAPPYIS